MKIHTLLQSNRILKFCVIVRVSLALAAPAQATDPRTNGWFTTYAGQYARVYTNSTMQLAGTPLTTWANTSLSQSLPAYCGVQEVYSSSNWVYVRSTGLASYTMGPWYLDAQKKMLFPNLPVNQQVFYSIPRTNYVPASKSVNGGGQIGMFVDGVAMYNSWDAYTWDSASNADVQNVTGYWNRDAYVNEGVSFDPGYAHQQNTGVYHYHADPLGLRYMLGDHVDFNASTKVFSEDTSTPTKHSPILGWVADGYPIYGPYGYSNATNANSGIRRMVSGFVLRNGQYGTSNLTANGRTTIPAWAVRLYNVSSNQTAPNVSTSYPLGRYMEDNDYLGDRINSSTGTNYQQGTDFDLDQYNGRWCVTPEFPGGTYAYFVAVDSSGVPLFPYDIARGYYGSPIGGNVVAITESVTTNFLGYTNLASTMNSPTAKNGTVTLSWSALEGGSYEVLATTNLSKSWTALATGLSPNETVGGYTNVNATSPQFYLSARAAVATYSSAGATILATNGVAPGGTAYAGQNVLLTITLPTTPPNPPLNAPTTPTVVLSNTTTSVIIIGQNVSRSATNILSAILSIPSGAPQASENVIVNFNNMPQYTLTGGFNVNTN